MNDTITAAERQRITEELLGISERQARISAELSIPDKGGEETDGENAAMRAQLEALVEKAAGLLSRYLDGLPERRLSRCPFTGEVLSMKIDDFGLDGFFWNNSAPRRPEQKFPGTYFAMDGALKLQGTPEKCPLLCSPGPDLPYVLPRLLQYDEIKAVISCIKIGPHTAYPIIYYADPAPEGVFRVNDWGTERYWEPGTPVPELFTPGLYIDVPAEPEEMDFDLEPWIKAGKLLWIPPGDESLTLHGHAFGCPYLDLPGSRNLKYIQNGEVWEFDPGEEVPETEDMDEEELRKLLQQIEEGEI
jgi:hypothetical protein